MPALDLIYLPTIKMSEVVSVPFFFPLAGLFIIFIVLKLVTFISISRSIRKDEFKGVVDSPVSFEKHLLTLEGHLNKYLIVFPMGIIFMLAWLLFTFLWTAYEGRTIDWLIADIDTVLLFLDGINQRVIEGMVGTRIILLYGIAWIFFSRWKANILRKYKLKYYKPRDTNGKS